MTKLNKHIEIPETEWKLERVSKSKSGEVIGKTYSCPVEFISFRKKRRNQTYSEEQRKEVAERLHKK